MKHQSPIQPPRWAQRLLSWYCRPEILEDLEGDLNEYFQRNIKSGTVRKAKLIYIIDVLKFFRPYTVRKPNVLNSLIHWIMLSSYIKTSGRNIVRNGLFSFINIFGLSVSMMVGLLMIGMLYDFLSFDKFHENHERIYRLTSNYQYLDRPQHDNFATSPFRAAAAIKESFPGVEDVAVFRRDFSGDVSIPDKVVPLTGLFGNASIFKVFSFRLIEGDPTTALKEPFSVVLTEKSAIKLFGEREVVGKIIQRQGREYTVTGVMEDVPAFSHIRFDILASISTRETLYADQKEEYAWDSMWDTWSYILVKEDADLSVFQQNLDRYAAEQDKTIEHTKISLSLYPLDNIMTGENQNNQIGPVAGATVIKVFGGLTLVVILSACFNYTNLSIARTFRRSREVGIRKTIGALRSHVIAQFAVESVMIALFALVLAFLLFLLVRPHFIVIEESFSQLLKMQLTPSLVGLFVLFAILVGLMAGIFPALFFSRLNAIQVLKNMTTIPRFRGFTIRKTLIVFQYSISIIAITVTLVIFKQYKHFVSYDLGFNTANILNVRLHGNKAEALKRDLLQLPEVQGISQSGLIQSLGSYWGSPMKNPEHPLDSGTAFYNYIDEHYLPLHEYKLLAGRNFVHRGDSTPESEVIVNEHILKRFNIADDPQDAIGKEIKFAGKTVTIVGVMKNFQYGKADNNTNGKEVLMRNAPSQAQYLNIKILSSDWPATYAKIEKIWNKHDAVHPLEARFYSEEIEQSFNGLKAAMKVGGFLTFLVISIASIGLLGMVVFTTETRLREISIRKVMGATESGLLFLLSKGFMKLLGIAAMIGIPVTYLFFTQVLLPNIANHAPVSIPEMMTGAVAVLFIALLMIGSHTLKVARTNPADVLKSE